MAVINDDIRSSTIPYYFKKVLFSVVLGIRIHMFWGLDPVVRGTDPDRLSSSKNSEKNLFCVFFMSFYLRKFKNDVNVPSKSNKQKNLIVFCRRLDDQGGK